MITLFGLQTYGTREVSKNTDSYGKLIGDIVIFRFIIAIICNLVLLIFTTMINKDSNFKIILLTYGLTLLPLSFNIDWFYNGIQEMHHNAVYNILKSLIPIIIILKFLTSSNSVIIPIASIVGLSVASSYQFVIYFLKYGNKRAKTKVKINTIYFKNYIIYGAPFLISGVLSMINNYIDRIVIGFTRGSGETGIYSASYYPIMFLINLIAILFTPIFPTLINYYHKNLKKELENFNDLVAKVVVTIALPISIGGIILSKQIILLVFNEDFLEAYKPLRILLIYIFILFVREIYGYQLNAWNMEKLYLKIIGISALSNLALNLIFTPRYGINIAATITMSTELINLFMMKKNANRVVHTKIFIYIMKVLPSTVIMGGFITIMKYYNMNVIIIIICSILVYSLSIILFKVFDLRDVKNVIVNS